MDREEWGVKEERKEGEKDGEGRGMGIEGKEEDEGKCVNLIEGAGTPS